MQQPGRSRKHTMTTGHKAGVRKRRGRWWPKILGAFLALGVCGSVAAAWVAYDRLGRTPIEILDYVELRLQGHTKIEWAARPVLDVVRESFDAPRKAERAMTFIVPSPPPRRGLEAIVAPEPTPVGATVWRVGPNEVLTRISDAARRARDGDVVEIMAGDYRGDVAVWVQKRLTIRGTGGAARLFADGRIAEGKAIWVIRNGDFDVSNIDFIGARANDGNGAGIRFESGNLRVRHCLFWDNQMGFIASNNKQATLSVESSEFAYSQVRGRWGHNLYVGSIASVSVTGSYFHHAGVGHLIKSRASLSDIRYNRFTDESGGRASYELNFPNGGHVRLVGNFVQQQQRTENGKIISFGEEGYTWPVNMLQMTSNTLVNDHPHAGTFVYIAPGADSVFSSNNLRVGKGIDEFNGRLISINDHSATWNNFVRAARYDYHLLAPVPEALRYQALPESVAAELTPVAHYVHPRLASPLTSPPMFVGADPRAP